MSRSDMVLSDSPRWTWRAVMTGVVVTAGLYLLLPSLERLSVSPEQGDTLRSVDTTELPPPALPAPREPEPRRDRAEPQPPRPELEEQRRRLAPLQVALDLSTAIGDVGGDFAVDFAVSRPALTRQVEDMVFELNELDEPPRPLARLHPFYPPQARLRQVEGVVVLEFVVDADGSVRDVVVVSAQPSGVFDGAAVRSVRRWRFAPGRREGTYVAVRVRQKVSFKLD